MSEFRPISSLAKIRRGASPRPIGDPKYFGGTIGWVRIVDVTRSSRLLQSTEQYLSPLGESLSVRVGKGDLIMSICGTIGRPIIVDMDACIHDGFVQFYDLKNVDPIFLYYSLQFSESTFVGMGQPGTQTNLNTSLAGKHKIYCPSLTKQKKIAAILTAIDDAIEKTEALIAKYQQLKAGLMHDLFTCGVLPNGQLRPPREQAPKLYRATEIGWIPMDWQTAKLGTMAKIVSGVTLGAKESPSDTIDAPYLRVANVQDGYLDLTEIKTVRISRKTLEYLRLQPGDVLMNEGGDFDKLGRGTVWAGEIEDCVHQNHVFRVRTDSSTLLPYYLAYFSESSFGKKYFVLSSKQSTNLASINSTQLNAYPVALPSISEQQEICRRLNSVNRRIDALKAEAAKLVKQKLGLMQDLLTGKVPVQVDEPVLKVVNG